MKHYHKILTALVIALLPIATFGAIKVHRVSGKVAVVKGSSATPVTTGQTLMPGDMLDIPQGATIEVINDVSGAIYSSTTPGRMTLSRMMLDAKEKSADNKGNINKHLRFGSGKKDDKKRIYVETGMVKRSLAEFDPEAGSIQLSADELSRFLRNYIEGNVKSKPLPFELTHTTAADENLSFRLVNTMDFPVYFNILKVSGNPDNMKVEISELGQPSGSYVILPSQAISRESLVALPAGQRHILIASHAHYDIDSLLELINKSYTPDDAASPIVDLPVYIMEF